MEVSEGMEGGERLRNGLRKQVMLKRIFVKILNFLSIVRTNSYDKQVLEDLKVANEIMQEDRDVLKKLSKQK